MSLLPGVPNMSPAPVSPTIKPQAMPTKGAPSGIAAIAHSVGKPGRTQSMGSLVGRHGAGGSAITGGDSLAHSLGHYGKNAPPGLSALGGAAGVDPTAHPGAQMIRGGSGVMKSHPRQGGLGPGTMGAPGDSSNYSMQDSDPE